MLSNNHIQLFCGNTNNLNPQSSSTLISTTSSTSSLGSNTTNINQRMSTINNNRHSTNNLASTRISMETNRPQNQSSQNQSNPVQIQNYITWINSHLKKRPGVKLVENLHSDLSNGVSLIHLIEVISGTVLTDVNLNPKTQSECKENVEKILKFMQQNSIKMHQTTSKEIIEGNLKSIMRLVLALAAHFKPTNVQPYSAFISKLNSNSNQNSTYSTCLSTLSSNNSNKQNFTINKRSQSTNNVNTNLTNSNNTNLNNTYVVNQTNQTNQQQQSQQSQQQTTKPSLNQTRNLDSMTHLVQAACVSLADVRRYKNENFNVKYVKRNNLQSPNSKYNSNYLNPINLNSNQTYTVNNNNNNNINANNNTTKIVNFSPSKNSTMISTASFLLSPNSAQPIASSTVLQPHNLIDMTTISVVDSNLTNVKYVKNKTYSLDKHERIEEEEKQDESPSKNSGCSNDEEKTNKNNNNTNSSDAKTIIIEQNSASTTDNNNKISTQPTQPTSTDKEKENDLILYNFEENEMNIKDVQKIKTMLLNLQTLLMTCNLEDLKPDDLDLENMIKKCQESEENDEQMQNQNENNQDVNTSTNSNNENPLPNLTLEEQISVFRSKIQQLEIINSELKNELNKFKNEATNKNGIQSGLRTRINEQDNTILEMKNEKLNLQLNNENLYKEKEDLRDQLESCMKQITSLKTELNSKDSIIDKMKIEMNDLIKEKNEQNKFVRQQVKNMTETLEIVQEKENALTGMIASTDRKLNMINNNLTNQTSKKDLVLMTHMNQKILSPDEFNLFKESVLKLRQNFSSNHPSQLLINIIEQSFSNIMNNLNPITSINPSSSTSGSSSLTSSSANSPVQTLPQSQSPSSTSSVHSSSSSISSYTQKLNTQIENKCEQESKTSDIPLINNESNVKKIISRLLSQTYMVPGNNGVNNQINGSNANNSNQTKTDVNKPNKITHVWENCVSKQSGSSLLTISSTCSSASTTISTNYSSENSTTSHSNLSALTQNNNNLTKCIYFIDKNSTPFMISIHKNIGSITLNDFKESVKLKQGNYKFRFKSQDPEFGILKEEITNDLKILPAFEGKIVAWIETLAN